MPFEPRKINPRHLIVLKLHWKGIGNQQIADIVGITAQHVSNIINMPVARELYATFQENVFESLADVQETLQAAAPELLNEKLRLALNAKDERVRSTSCTELLQMSGHKPVSRIVVERQDSPHDKYANMSEDQLRHELLKGVGNAELLTKETETVH